MTDYEIIPKDVDDLSGKIVNSIFRVHMNLGPGLLESIYEKCLCIEFDKKQIPYEKQLQVPIIYEGVKITPGVKIDILVDKKIVVELKSVEKMIKLYEAQVLTYLKLTRIRLGILVNFNVPMIKDGIKRLAL